MTEAEWVTGWDYDSMYDAIRRRTTTRQVRLYMAACCRLLEVAFFDPRVTRAVDAAEQCADDPAAEAEANAVWDELVTFDRPPRDGTRGDLARVIADVFRLLDEWWHDGRYPTIRHAIAHAAFLCLRSHPRDILTGGDGNAAECCARFVVGAGARVSGREAAEGESGGRRTGDQTRRSVAGLLRDIFGNPFRPVTADPAWLTSTVLSLAEGIYSERAFDRLPILADALQDAGCGDAEILNHCRGGGVHVRACWVLDLVLGKG
jgi:hypothetical protein